MFSVLLLSACGNSKVVQPDRVESLLPKTIHSSTKENSLKTAKTYEGLEIKFDPLKAKEKVKDFIDSYYNYSSENKRNILTKAFCTSDVQKKLHLVKVDKEIKMESSITSVDIYEEEEGKYLILVSYELNGNQVTPQVLKISVEQDDNDYLVNRVDFPLMN